MSKLTEYLKLIPLALGNPKNIAQGWLTEAKLQLKSIGVDMLSEDEEAEIVRRRTICQTCPLNSINAKTSEEYKKLYGVNYENPRADFHCAICSCFIVSKTSSFNSACGLENYNAKNPNNKQPLKWDVYIKKEN